MTAREAAALALASAALVAGACRNTADGAREDARRAAREAEKAADDARKEIDRAAHDARREVKQAMGEARGAMREAESAMKDAGRDVQHGARESAAELGAAKQVLDVRAALAVSREISSASDIDVRSDEAGRTVILQGTAASASERQAAERIARASADGLRVENRLRIPGAH